MSRCDYNYHGRTCVNIAVMMIIKAHIAVVLQDEGIFLKEDPAMILMEYMRLKNLRLVDLFHCLDADKSNSLSRDEFRRGLLVITELGFCLTKSHPQLCCTLMNLCCSQNHLYYYIPYFLYYLALEALQLQNRFITTTRLTV